jgi:hypothetical protein
MTPSAIVSNFPYFDYIIPFEMGKVLFSCSIALICSRPIPHWQQTVCTARKAPPLWIITWSRAGGRIVVGCSPQEDGYWIHEKSIGSSQIGMRNATNTPELKPKTRALSRPFFCVKNQQWFPPMYTYIESEFKLYSIQSMFSLLNLYDIQSMFSLFKLYYISMLSQFNLYYIQSMLRKLNLYYMSRFILLNLYYIESMLGQLNLYYIQSMCLSSQP